MLRASEGFGEALVCQQLGGFERGAEPFEAVLRHGGDGDVLAVGALVVRVGGCAAALETGLLAGSQELHDLLGLHGDHAADERAIDVLADAVPFAHKECRRNPERQEHRADLVGEATDERLRLTAGAFALFVHHAAERLRDVVVAAAVGPRPLPPPGRSRGKDDVGPQLLQVFVAKAEPLHDAGAEVFDNDIDGRHDPRTISMASGTLRSRVMLRLPRLCPSK